MDINYKYFPEVFFHFLWKYRMLSLNLTTTCGEEVQIIHPGKHNTDAGPDFLYARVRIGNTIWAGNVEIHTRGSDWYRHKHDKDPAYNNIILHVVAEHDMTATNQAGRELYTLCISDKFNRKLIDRFREINENLLWVPCLNLIRSVDDIHIISCIHTMAIERLTTRAKEIDALLKSCNMDWEECCYRLIARQFGAKINITQFDMLSKSISVRILMKYHKDLFRIESLLLGQSGMLHASYRETYPKKLKKEHAYLSAKHNLSPMPGYLWKFLRLRPAGFPNIRIAHLASLYETNQSLLQEILDAKDLQDLIRLFTVDASPYWDTHYVFGKKSIRLKKSFGLQSIHLLLINAIIPMLHHYGIQMDKDELCERAIGFLEKLPPEDNAVIRKWKNAGINVANALETQGLLQLKKTRCDNKKCLDCNIGLHLLKHHPS